MRWSAAVLLIALSAAIVGVAKIGPVVLVLTATHGVHAGDSLALVPLLGAMLLLPGRSGEQSVVSSLRRQPVRVPVRGSSGRRSAVGPWGH